MGLGVGEDSTDAGTRGACSSTGGRALLVAGGGVSVVEGTGVVVEGRVVDGGGVVIRVAVVVSGSFGSSSFPNRAPQPPHRQIAPMIAPTTIRVLRLARLRRSTLVAC